jgi:hypothetical protein
VGLEIWAVESVGSGKLIPATSAAGREPKAGGGFVLLATDGYVGPCHDVLRSPASGAFETSFVGRLFAAIS